MAFTKVVGAGIHTLSNIASHNINSSGIITATKFVGPFDGTNGDFSGNVTIDGNLTVNGTTTTLDTNLTEVDKVEVSANNSTVGVAITQSGSGDILRLYDGTSQVVTVLDTGEVGLGTDNPTQILHILDASPIIQFTDTNGLGSRINADSGNLYFDTHNNNRDIIFRGGNSSANEVTRITGDGDVGIGTATIDSSYGTNLNIHSSGNNTGARIKLTDGTSGTGNVDGFDIFGVNGRAYVFNRENYEMVLGTDNKIRLRIDDDGAISVGHNPGQSTGTNTQNAILTLKGYPNENESSAAILALIRGYDTTSATANHTLGRIVFGDKQAGEYAFIEGEVEANGAVGDTPGRLVFSTAPDNTSAPTEKVRIDKDGILWVNYGNPQSSSLMILDKDGTGDAELRFYNAGSNKAKIALDSDEHLTFDVNGDERLRIRNNGTVNIGGDYTNTTGKLKVTGTTTIDGNLNVSQNIIHTDDPDTKIEFLTNTISLETNGRERVYIKSDGKVGINTTTPYSALEIQGDGGTNDARITFTRHGSPSNGTVIGNNFYRIGTDSVAGFGAYRESAMDDAYFAFHTQPTGGSFGERLRITSVGKVGINQDTPTADLEVCPINTSVDTATIFINAKNHDTNVASEAILKFGYGHSGSPDAVGHIKLAENGGNNFDGDLIFGVPTNNSSGGSVTNERFRIRYNGQVSISDAGNTFGNARLNIRPANRTTAFSASDGDTWHDLVLMNGGAAQTNAVGIAFEINDGASYHKNAGTGICAVKNGTNSDYGCDLLFITRPQSAVAQERARITSAGDFSIGGRDAALANYASGSTTPTQLAVVKDGGAAGSGYHEVAHFTGGNDSNDTGAIVRITQFNNDRGLFIKAGRGTSDQAKALIGLRDSAANDTNFITVTQNTDQITSHRSVDIDNGYNLSLGGTSNTHAPLHVKSENGSYGKNAVFGASGWVNDARYHQTDANVTLLGRDIDGNDKGVGIEFIVRNTGGSNWNHGAITFGRDGFLKIFTGGAGTYESEEQFTIDNQGNEKLGTTTPTAFTGSAPNHTQRFLGKKCMQGSVTSTVTLTGSGTGIFDLGRLWITDDSSTEVFIQVMRNDSTTYQTHYCKAFIQKVRGTGMSQGHILYQNGAAYSGGSGFRVTSIESGGYTGGSSAHGTEIHVAGGAGGVIYRMVCFYTTLSKNDMY